jgi:predicted acyltransferase
MNWHEAAQSWLEAAGLGTANASLIYSLAAMVICWILLWFYSGRRSFSRSEENSAAQS